MSGRFNYSSVGGIGNCTQKVNTHSTHTSLFNNSSNYNYKIDTQIQQYGEEYNYDYSPIQHCVNNAPSHNYVIDIKPRKTLGQQALEILWPGGEEFNWTNSNSKGLVGIFTTGGTSKTKSIQKDKQVYSSDDAKEYAQKMTITNPEKGLTREQNYQKHLTFYNDTMKQVADVNKKLLEEEEIYKSSLKILNTNNGSDNAYAKLDEEHYRKVESLNNQKKDLLKQVMSDEEAEARINEKTYFGNTSSELSKYGSQSAWTALISFTMKEVTSFSTTFLSDLKDGKTISEAAKDGGMKALEDGRENFIVAGGQGLGQFAGLVLSNGDSTMGTAGSTIASNIISYGYKLITAETSEKRMKLIEDETSLTLFKTADQLAASAVPFISSNTASCLANVEDTVFKQQGRLIFGTIDMVRDHDVSFSRMKDVIADSFADIDAVKFGGDIMSLAGGVIGDLVEYKITKKSVTGVGSTIGSTSFNLPGRSIAYASEICGAAYAEGNFFSYLAVGYGGKGYFTEKEMIDEDKVWDVPISEEAYQQLISNAYQGRNYNPNYDPKLNFDNFDPSDPEQVKAAFQQKLANAPKGKDFDEAVAASQGKIEFTDYNFDGE